jgi:hypothetical protein
VTDGAGHIVSTLNLAIRGTAFIMVLALTGCATAPKFQTQVAPQTSGVNNLYIYSFLDVREKQIGANFLQEVQRDLQDELTQRGIRSKQLWFNNSPQRAQYSLTESDQRIVWRGRESTIRIPIPEVIAGNVGDERNFGARYRLVISPSGVSNTGIGFEYLVTWVMMDTRTGQVVWNASSKMKTVNLIKADEDPTGRAHLFVNGLMQEMTTDKLL